MPCMKEWEIEKAGDMRGARSKPGEGRQVNLFWLWDDLGAAPDSEGGWTWGGSQGEDFADSVAPMTVKVDPSMNDVELVWRLRKLAREIEAGFGEQMIPRFKAHCPSREDQPFVGVAAVTWLQTALAGGPVSVPMLQDAARQDNVPWGLIENARVALKVRREDGVTPDDPPTWFPASFDPLEGPEIESA